MKMSIINKNLPILQDQFSTKPLYHFSLMTAKNTTMKKRQMSQTIL